MIKKSDVIISKKVCEKQNWMIMEVGIELESSPGLLKLFSIQQGQEAHLFSKIEAELPAKVITEIYGDVREEAAKAKVLLDKMSCLLTPEELFQLAQELRCRLRNLEEAGLHEALHHYDYANS